MTEVSIAVDLRKAGVIPSVVAIQPNLVIEILPWKTAKYFDESALKEIVDGKNPAHSHAGFKENRNITLVSDLQTCDKQLLLTTIQSKAKWMDYRHHRRSWLYLQF
jgi:hypothetical protein